MTVSLPVELPDNLPACHAIILRQAEVIESLTARVEELLTGMERLSRDLATLKRQLFGSRRERFVADRGEAPAEEEVAVEQRGFPPELPVRAAADVQGPTATDHRRFDSPRKSLAPSRPAEGAAGIVE
jgi:hypothetical protein